MKSTVDMETAIVGRCVALGLTRPQAQALADAMPFPSTLMHVLGLDPDTLAPLPSKPWLKMAAQTSSVSYRGTLTPETLLAVLVTGDIPAEFRVHVGYFLSEAPMQLVTMAIEQASQQSGVPITRIWHSVAQLDRALNGFRLRDVRVSPHSN